jgi:hypothetical protein
MQNPLNDDDRLIPDPDVAKRYGRALMTLWRWDHDPSIGFPPPYRIDGRKYRRESELLAWERGLKMRQAIDAQTSEVVVEESA